MVIGSWQVRPVSNLRNLLDSRCSEDWYLRKGVWGGQLHSVSFYHGYFKSSQILITINTYSGSEDVHTGAATWHFDASNFTRDQ